MTNKTLSAFALLCVGLLGGAAEVRAATRPELVLAPINRTFIPAGFDNNDNAQIVVTGGYPNSCYMVGHTQYWVDHVAKRINIEVTAYKKPQEYCLQVYVPFQQEISVGVMQTGQYQVTVNQDVRTTRVLNIKDAPGPNPDNYIYAPVTEVIRVAPREFLLRGTFHSSCMSIGNVMVNYEPGEVIAILPVANYDGSCFETGQARAWETKVQLKNDLNGEYLLHVRSLNGDAVNTVHTFSNFDF